MTASQKAESSPFLVPRLRDCVATGKNVIPVKTGIQEVIENNGFLRLSRTPIRDSQDGRFARFQEKVKALKRGKEAPLL